MKINSRKIAVLFILICIAISCGTILPGSVTIAGDEAEAKANESGQSEKNNSPLLPVLVGGLIALVGSIGGGTLGFMLQSRREAKVFKRSKLEELTALACQCDDWLDKLFLGYLVQGDIGATIEKFPVNQMKMIQALYFPSLKAEVQALSNSAKEFRKMAIMERKNLKETHEYSNSFKEQYDPKQKAVLEAIESLLKKASTTQI